MGLSSWAGVRGAGQQQAVCGGGGDMQIPRILPSHPRGALQPHPGTRAASALLSNGRRMRLRSLLGQLGGCELQSHRDQQEQEAESPEQGLGEQGGPTMAMPFLHLSPQSQAQQPSG